MVVNLEAGSAVGQSIAFFEEETDTAKVKTTLEKMLDDAKAREEELQRLPSIQSRIAFFEAARRQHKNGEEKQIKDHQENLIGGVALVSSDSGNRRMNATIIIQRHFKRWMAHRKFKEQHKGALALQTVIRGYLARRHYDARRKFVVRRTLQSYLEEELVQERCALAKNVGSFGEVKSGKQSSCESCKSFGEVKSGKQSSCESCKNHNKSQLHKMKAKDGKHGRTKPKGWKRWWELRFSGCLRWSSQEDCSSATEFPHTSLLQEHVRLSMLKELGGERTEKLQDCHSIAQHEKLASCSLSVDAAFQQCHAKHQLVSSALKPPPLSLEDHCQLSSSDESGGESRPEHAFNSTERSTRSSEKLPEFHSVVQCKDHPACNPSVDVAPQKVYQCQANTVSSAMLPPQNPPLEEHVQIASLKEPGGNHRPEPHDLIEKRAKSSEKLQECEAKVVTSALDPPPTLSPGEPVRPVPLKKTGGELRSDSLPESIQKSVKPSEKLGKCHSVDQREKHASCKPSVDAATQLFLHCQAMIVASAPEPPLLPPLEESVRPVPLKEAGEEHRSEPSEPIQKSTRPSEKLMRSQSLVQREKHSSCTREAQPTAATKLNVVAEQKTDQKSCRDDEMTELKRQKSQRSTTTDSGFHLAHDPDRPSRRNRGRMQQSPQHPRAHADPRAHAATRTVTRIGHPSDVAAPVKQKVIRDDSSAVGKADRQAVQLKPSRLGEGGIAVRHSPARPTQLDRTESRKSEWWQWFRKRFRMGFRNKGQKK